MSTITSVQTNKLIDAEFVKMIVTFTNGTTQIERSYFFSSSYKAETINGDVYTDLGGLVNVGSYQRNILSTQYDTSIMVAGLDPNYIYMVAGSPANVAIPVLNQQPIPIGYYPLIKGSKVEIRRGFYDGNYNLINTSLRYSGIVTSYSIKEERDSGFKALDDTYTITIQCSALSKVLENKVVGRKTNVKSWQFYFPSDTSMNRVAGLENIQFNFGKDV
jgi:cytochrome c-type biogenesis protein CcmE